MQMDGFLLYDFNEFKVKERGFVFLKLQRKIYFLCFLGDFEVVILNRIRFNDNLNK